MTTTLDKLIGKSNWAPRKDDMIVATWHGVDKVGSIIVSTTTDVPGIVPGVVLAIGPNVENTKLGDIVLVSEMAFQHISPQILFDSEHLKDISGIIKTLGIYRETDILADKTK